MTKGVSVPTVKKSKKIVREQRAKHGLKERDFCLNKFLKLLYPIKCDLNEQFRKLCSPIKQRLKC